MSDNFTPEQVVEYLDALPKNTTYAQRRRIAKTLGHDLAPPEVSDQLQAVSIVRGHVGKVTKKTPKPTPTDYICVPSLVLDKDNGTKGFWLKLSVARSVLARMTEVLDAEDVK